MAKERILVTSTTEKSALEREDVILEVTEDLDMGNETVFLKAGSTIVFNGGMLKNVTDYMELLDKKVNSAFVGGNSVCVPPVLIGHGRGTTKERNSSTIAGKLCSGSTYYDTTLGKMFHLNEALQWVE